MSTPISAQYRKRPVVIEACLTSDALSAAKGPWQALPWWLRGAYESGNIVFASDGVYIKTLEGEMHAQLTDWIIRGVQGEIYPCKPDIFEASYERVGTEP